MSIITWTLNQLLKEAANVLYLVAGDRVDAVAGSSSVGQSQAPHVQPKGGKALWVMNGRIYNYRKEGATPVPNQAAAEEAVQAQRAATKELHGLGAGGNKPAPKGWAQQAISIDFSIGSCHSMQPSKSAF